MLKVVRQVCYKATFSEDDPVVLAVAPAAPACFFTFSPAQLGGRLRDTLFFA
jgi:hypothetical protein